MNDFVERPNQPMVRACDLHDETTDKMRERGEYVLVTEASHPLLYDCLEAISHDNGEGAGHADYTIPFEFDLRDAVETELRDTSAEDRHTLSIGEEGEQQEVTARYGMRIAPLFLEAFFLDFYDEDNNACLEEFMQARRENETDGGKIS